MLHGWRGELGRTYGHAALGHGRSASAGLRERACAPGFLPNVITADDDKPQEQSSGEIVFEDVKSFVFGAPNDEALQGHRLYDLGLRFYSSYEVLNSAWIADLCIRNRVRPSHKDALFKDLRHFILTFHDSTVEVVAKAYATSVEAEKPLDYLSRRLRDRQTWS